VGSWFDADPQEALRAALTASEKDRDRWHETATRLPEPVLTIPWWRRLAG
jgi:hypothetical protein